MTTSRRPKAEFCSSLNFRPPQKDLSFEENVVANYTPALIIAKRFLHRNKKVYGNKVGWDDVYTGAVIGLMTAIKQYKPERKQWPPYVEFRIRAGILDEIRKLTGRNKDVAKKRKARQLDVFTMPFESIAGYPARQQKHHNHELTSKIFKLANELSPVHLRILKLHYYQQRSLAQAACILSLSPSWVSQLHAQTLQYLRSHLQP